MFSVTFHACCYQGVLILEKVEEGIGLTNEKGKKSHPESSQDNFHSFFGRIDNSKNCFRDLLTFSIAQPNCLICDTF